MVTFSLAGDGFQKTFICDVETTFVTTFVGTLRALGVVGGGVGDVPPAVVALTGEDQFDVTPLEFTA